MVLWGDFSCSSGFEAGQREGWHRVLCSDLTPEQRNVAWTRLVLMGEFDVDLFCSDVAGIHGNSGITIG